MHGAPGLSMRTWRVLLKPLYIPSWSNLFVSPTPRRLLLGIFSLSFSCSPSIMFHQFFFVQGSAIALCFRIVLWSYKNNENTLAHKWTNRSVEQNREFRERLKLFGNVLDSKGGILNQGQKWWSIQYIGIGQFVIHLEKNKL